MRHWHLTYLNWYFCPYFNQSCKTTRDPCLAKDTLTDSFASITRLVKAFEAKTNICPI